MDFLLIEKKVKSEQSREKNELRGVEEKTVKFNEDKLITFPVRGGAEDHFSNAPYLDEDLEITLKTLGKVVEFAEKNPAEKRIVYLAIGSANLGGYGNPSHGRYVKPENIAFQQFPPFLKTALKQGYQVISINMDSFGETTIKTEEKGKLLKVEIAARFPLSNSVNESIVLIINCLNSIKGEKGTILVNAVSDLDYTGIIQVASKTHATYIKSYLERNKYFKVTNTLAETIL